MGLNVAISSRINVAISLNIAISSRINVAISLKVSSKVCPSSLIDYTTLKISVLEKRCFIIYYKVTINNISLKNNKVFAYAAVVAEWLELCNLQRQQSCLDPGLNPAWDYGIDRTKLEIMQ